MKSERVPIEVVKGRRERANTRKFAGVATFFLHFQPGKTTVLDHSDAFKK